ncbi:NAD(P)H-dependent flavin oxidoreductase [Leucobacter sp. GX24907]
MTVTEWAAELGLRAPIVCAPMGGTAGGALASAVSRAGGLGMIGMGSTASRERLAGEIARLETGGAPFGIGFAQWGLDRVPEMLDMALEAGPAVLSVSFVEWEGMPDLRWIDRARAAGVQTVTQVATVAEAKAAVDAGVDAVVARGLEGGGHGDHQHPRRELLAQVLEAVDVPVLSAGAVSTAKDVSDALGAGAAAVWVGTAFAASPEALTSDATRRVLMAADGEQTTVTRVADVALGYPWPERFPERVVGTAFVDRWDGHEADLEGDEVAREEFRAAAAAGDHDVAPVNAGRGVGLLTETKSAAQVIAELMGDEAVGE